MTTKKRDHLFKPGQSGNPKGRPKGALNKDSAARALIFAQSGEIVRKALKEALNGNQALLGQLLSIVSPAQRAELAPVQIPGASDAIAAGRFEDALSLISQASLDGTISPDAAKQLTDQLKAAEEAKRLSFLQDQLHQLREKVINGRTIEHRPMSDAPTAWIEDQPMRTISHG